MSLPASAWRYVGTAAGGTTLASFFTALLGLGQALVYADGSTRTPGSGSAGTWTEVAVGEALSVVPALSPLNHRLLMAGSATSVTGAVAASPDTTALGVVMVGVNKNSGAYSDWKSATPYTSGQWFGFWRSLTVGSAAQIYLYESTTSIYVVITQTAGANSLHFMLGCPIDPQSTTEGDAESDGRLYGQMTTGTGTVVATILSAATTSVVPLGHSASASAQHFGVFTPGGSTIIPCVRAITLAVAGTATGLKSRSGRFYRYPIPVRSFAGTETMGEAYGIRMFNNATLPQRQVDVAPIGYVITEDSVNQQEALFLEYA